MYDGTESELPRLVCGIRDPYIEVVAGTIAKDRESQRPAARRQDRLRPWFKNNKARRIIRQIIEIIL